MLFLKLLQSIISTLNSEGTPRQIAAGFALGAALGLTPLVNIHNLLVFAAACLLNVSFGGFLLGWTVFVPLGFALDPLFHAVGLALLQAPALTGLWTALYNTTGVPLTNFNNSVVLGSFVSWVVLWLPIFLLARWLVVRYRAHVYERLKKMRFFQALAASKLYNTYLMFRPRVP
jgi:uncharacterized protein (TIGR03546 family)